MFYYRDPYYYLFFSTHLFTGPHYQTEVARSSDILGPYERLSTPISHTDFDRYLNGLNCTFVAPGMHEVFICICLYFLHLIIYQSCDITRLSNRSPYNFLGHGSVIQAIDGVYWYFYHSWRYKELNKNPPGRVLVLDKINWDILPDGPWPYVGAPSDTVLPAPITKSNYNFLG